MFSSDVRSDRRNLFLGAREDLIRRSRYISMKVVRKKLVIDAFSMLHASFACCPSECAVLIDLPELRGRLRGGRLQHLCCTLTPQPGSCGR